jgi:hypothetical protein
MGVRCVVENATIVEHAAYGPGHSSTVNRDLNQSRRRERVVVLAECYRLIRVIMVFSDGGLFTNSVSTCLTPI